MDIQSLQKESMHCDPTLGFSARDIRYWTHPDFFMPLLRDLPLLKNFERQMELRSNHPHRSALAEILERQYQNLPSAHTALEQIEKLKSKTTFTVIGAHQPCLMGGPLFWVYKIASVIGICRALKKLYPANDFIPVYYCGSEDHDFEEINHVQIFQNRIQWKEQAGHAVGRLPPDQLDAVFTELEQIFQRQDRALEYLSLHRKWKASSKTYGGYFRNFVDHLFGKYGLLYFDPDDATAKSLFAPIIKRELEESFIYKTSQSANQFLESQDLALQVNPRELNLFYHGDHGRIRINRTDNGFELPETEIRWTTDQILRELEQAPERFSPNVLSRPLYQEFLFPNLAFVGGGGELAYWMQLKPCFDAAGIPYPLLYRRMSAFHLDASTLQRIHKTGFQPKDFFKSIQELEQEYIKRHPESHFLKQDDLHQIESLLDQVSTNCAPLDAPTRSSIEGELQKIKKSLEHIKGKHDKAVKAKHELEVQQLRKTRESLFPQHSIQERIYSFLPIYFKFGEAYFDFLIEAYDPDKAEVLLIRETIV